MFSILCDSLYYFSNLLYAFNHSLLHVVLLMLSIDNLGLYLY